MLDLSRWFQRAFGLVRHPSQRVCQSVLPWGRSLTIVLRKVHQKNPHESVVPLRSGALPFSSRAPCSSLFQSCPFGGLITPPRPSIHTLHQSAFTCSLLLLSPRMGPPTLYSLPPMSSPLWAQLWCFLPPLPHIRSCPPRLFWALSEFASCVEYGNSYFKAKGNIAKSVAALRAPLSPHFLVGFFFKVSSSGCGRSS